MANTTPFQRGSHAGIVHGTTVYPDGSSSVFSRLPHHDFVTFMGMAQRMMPYLDFWEFLPNFERSNVKRGLSGAVYGFALTPQLGIVYKRFLVTLELTEETAYKALICELMVLEHPIIKSHSNVQLLAVT
jgi:hypothetical protein